MKKILLISILAAAVLFSCKKKEGPAPTTTINSEPPTDIIDTIGEGDFTSYDHGLGGSAGLYENDEGEKTLRLKNFNMTSGPDVYVFLSTTSSYSAANVIEITQLTSGYSNSNLNFAVNSTSYTSAHKYVLVYCVQFSSLFGYAELIE